MLPVRFGDPRLGALLLGASLALTVPACSDSTTFAPEPRPPLVDRLVIDGPVAIRADARLEYTILALGADDVPVAGADSLIDVRTSDGLLAGVVEVRDVDPTDGRIVATLDTRRSGRVDLEAVYRRPFQVSRLSLEIFPPAPPVDALVGTYGMDALLVAARTTCTGLAPSRLDLEATVEQIGTADAPVLALRTVFGELSGPYDVALRTWAGTGERAIEDGTVELTLSGAWDADDGVVGFIDDLRLVFHSTEGTCEAGYLLRMSRAR